MEKGSLKIGDNRLGVFQSRTRWDPDKIAFLYLEHGEREAERLTYAELEDRAQGSARFSPSVFCLCSLLVAVLALTRTHRLLLSVEYPGRFSIESISSSP
jgi:hypothetical protein